MDVPNVPYSPAGLSISKAAHRLAAQLGHQTNSGHLLLSIINEPTTPAAQALARHKITQDRSGQLMVLLERQSPGPVTLNGISVDLHWSFTLANFIAHFLRSEAAAEHLLCSLFYRLQGHDDRSQGLIFNPDSPLIGARILREMEVNMEGLRDKLLPDMARTFIRQKISERK